jgi:hypothetical protein
MAKRALGSGGDIAIEAVCEQAQRATCPGRHRIEIPGSLVFTRAPE